MYRHVVYKTFADAGSPGSPIVLMILSRCCNIVIVLSCLSLVYCLCMLLQQIAWLWEGQHMNKLVSGSVCYRQKRLFV